MGKTLVDTNIFVAARNEDDALHEPARKLLAKIEEPIITDYVFDEFTNVATRRKNKQAAIETGNYILQSIDIEFVSAEDFMEAWSIFREHKHLSFTDATNIAVMRSLGIKHIATFDEAFKNVPGIIVVQ